MALDALSDSGFQNWEGEVVRQSFSHLSEQDAKSKLVVALDAPTVPDARKLCAKLRDSAGVFKVGLELVMSKGGLAFARDLIEEEHQVFLDMKLLDIGNTVERAVANVASSGFQFLTVHATNRKTLRAAVAGRNSQREQNLKLLAVTVLTSFDENDLREEGVFGQTPLELAVHRAKMAEEEGFDGVIASGHEAKSIRQVTNSNFIIKVPGIRPAGSEIGDQTRTMTPAEAMEAGASYIVVGRPIYKANDPAAVARQIVREMCAARISDRH
ncbi:MAG: orotidine-5'-phosphate decarboxylase [Hyphomicrobium sp.]|uniref:orotidine-5'-phosphate decarboxylase n=1 Tax=Hyphomicrobium sp. TaxID=82 RepID=UPI0039E32021